MAGAREANALLLSQGWQHSSFILQRHTQSKRGAPAPEPKDDEKKQHPRRAEATLDADAQRSCFHAWAHGVTRCRPHACAGEMDRTPPTPTTLSRNRWGGWLLCTHQRFLDHPVWGGGKKKGVIALIAPVAGADGCVARSIPGGHLAAAHR
jgi:hypothetical protein